MDCGRIQTLFTAYRDRELDQRNLLLLENHLAGCSECAMEWAYLKAVLRKLEAVRPLPAPPDLLPGIHAKLERRSVGLMLGRALTRIFSPAPLTAAASGLAAILLFTIFSGPGSVPGPGPVTDPSTDRMEAESRIDPPVSLIPPATMVGAELPGKEAPGEIHHLPRLAFTPSVLPVEHPEAVPSAHHPYYRYQAAHGKFDPVHAHLGRHFDPADLHLLGHGRNLQIGAPLMPDVIIRVHHLSPEDLVRLHHQIQESGNWQSRCYYRDYLLVLVDPGELEALYGLLQRHRLAYSHHTIREVERSPLKSLLVAIQP